MKAKNEKHENSKSLEKTDCKKILCEENKILNLKIGKKNRFSSPQI